MKYILIISSSLLISFNNIKAQSFQEINLPEQPGFVTNLKADGLSFYNTSLNLIQSPLHFDEQDLILTGIIVGATAFSLGLDNPVRDNIGKLQSNTLDKVTRYGENFGNGKYVAGVSGLIYLGGHLFQDKELRETGLMLAEAIFLNGVVTEGLKIIAGRSRPFINEGNYKIDFFEMELEDEENSLPSGHTSTAFAVATVLSQRIDNIYASIGLYSLAGLTAFQRMYKDKHWISDTILGAALGTVIGLKVVKLNTDNDNANSSINMNITPVVSSHHYGVGVLLRF
ncbi:MAG TPA: phosphatase PAP2 family protein [Ignavibacteriaceae bacterium]|nr:phosphatase PAP2 family protein [Ignavibacteriaceae bacterium]